MKGRMPVRVVATLLSLVLWPNTSHADQSACQPHRSPQPRAAREGAQRVASGAAVTEVVALALTAAGLSGRGSDSAVRDAAARARLRGILPTLRVGIRRGSGLDASLTAGTVDRSNISRDDDLTLEASATFDLGRLLFAREEVALLNAERLREETRRSLIAEVVHGYFERRRLLQELESGAGTVAERQRSRLDADRLLAQLSALAQADLRHCW